MYYYLSDHIYIAGFRDEIILLDTKKDKYSIFSGPISLLLSQSVNIDTSHTDKFLRHQSSYFQKLIDDNILTRKKVPYPFYIDRKIHSNGVSNVDWSLPLGLKKVPLSLQVYEALIVLIKVNFHIKFRGFYRTIQLIKKSRKSKLNYIIPQEENLKELAEIVNKACLIYPTRTKCLEWAMTYVLLALKRQWRCNLEIGVQNYPFLAHAWVECDGKVILDSPDLRKGLALILNEPFRRLKI